VNIHETRELQQIGMATGSRSIRSSNGVYRDGVSMKRYMLFVWKMHYPGGGSHDLAGSFGTIKAAKKAAVHRIQEIVDENGMSRSVDMGGVIYDTKEECQKRFMRFGWLKRYWALDEPDFEDPNIESPIFVKEPGVKHLHKGVPIYIQKRGDSLHLSTQVKHEFRHYAVGTDEEKLAKAMQWIDAKLEEL
jgi:hypothetical protein